MTSSYQTSLPSEVTICAGSRVSLYIDNKYWPTPCVQWEYFNGIKWRNVANGIKPCLEFIAREHQDGYRYRARVQTKCEQWISNSTTLRVNYIDIIPPTSQWSLIGGTVTFTSSAISKPPVRDIWWEVSTDGGQSWSLVPESNASSLILTNIQAYQYGNLYRAVFDNGCVSRSNPAELIVYRVLTYVTNYNSNTVSVIDTATNEVVKTITVGINPRGVAITPNGRYAYVTNYGNNTVNVIDTSTNEVVETIGVIRPYGVAITPNGKYAYITNYNVSTVSVVDTSTNTVIGSPIPVGILPKGIAITPNGRYAYVANSSSNTVSLIDTSTNQIVDTIPVGVNPRGLAITPNGKYVYVSNYSGSVSVVDTSVNEVVDTIVLNGPIGVAIIPNGEYVYVANSGIATVSVINTSTNNIVGTVNVGVGPEGVATTPNGTYVYVTNNSSNTVSIIETSTNAPLPNTISVGDFPTGVAIGNVPLY